MLNEEIEKVRERLHDMLMKYDFLDGEVLEVSKQLDILILRYLQKPPSPKTNE